MALEYLDALARRGANDAKARPLPRCAEAYKGASRATLLAGDVYAGAVIPNRTPRIVAAFRGGVGATLQGQQRVLPSLERSRLAR